LKELEIGKEEFNKYVTNEMETQDTHMPTYTDAQIKAMTAYMTPAQVEEFKKGLAEMKKAPTSYSTVKSSSIVFNGKKFGPFHQIQRFFLTEDGKNFYAIGSEEIGKQQFQNKMVTSASAKSLILKEWESPVSCFASPDNSEFGYMAIGMSNQKRVITLASGKTYEMELSNEVSEVWFSPTDNHLMYFIKDQLYRDGQVIKTFENPHPSPCQLFLSSDGQSMTVIKNGISFADGDYFQYPLQVVIVNVGGKRYYKWLAQDNNEVAVYQKPY
jgi:hypothetical protein